MSKKKRIYIIICFLIAAVAKEKVLIAQENNNYFQLTKESLDTSKLSFDIQNVNFIKNNEYFGEYIEGFTNLGINVQPSFRYAFSEKIEFEVGGFFLKYSGRNEFTEIEPVLAVKYNFLPGYSITLGTIKGSLNHNLPEPIYDFERFLTEPIENGLQILANKPHFDVDLWVDWDQFILHNDPFQEKFSAGLSTKLKVFKPTNKSNIEIPLQILFRHNGGQITTAQDPLLTIMNSRIGLSYVYSLPESFIKTYLLSCNYLAYEDFSPQKLQAFKDGYGVYTTLELQSKNFDLFAGYWYAEQFIAPFGSYLFQSISMDKAYVENSIRQLTTIKLSYHKEIVSGINFAFRIESYYDLNAKIHDYSMGLYIIFNRSFFFKNTFR